MAPTTEVLDTVSLEKQTDVHVEEALTRKNPKELADDEEFDSEFTRDDWRRIKRRIDRRLVVTCGFMYTISVMDRNNVGAAAIAGLTAELELTVGYRYVGPPNSLLFIEMSQCETYVSSSRWWCWLFSPRTASSRHRQRFCAERLVHDTF